jgi:hypothetical protein
MTDDDKPYTIHSPTKITLSPEAKYWAEQHGMRLEAMAKHILQQEKLRDAGLSQRQGES